MPAAQSASIPVLLSLCGEEVEVRALIEYTVTPGSPARGPSYASGGEPAEGPEIEISEIEIEVLDTTKKPPVLSKEPAPLWLYNFIVQSNDVREMLLDHADWE